jgi:hypothetical protein
MIIPVERRASQQQCCFDTNVLKTATDWASQSQVNSRGAVHQTVRNKQLNHLLVWPAMPWHHDFLQCQEAHGSWQHRIKRIHALGYLLRKYWSDALNGFYSIKIRSDYMKNDLLSSKQEKKSKTFCSNILILMLDTEITTERKSQYCTLISWTLKHEIWGWQFLFIYLQFLGQKLATSFYHNIFEIQAVTTNVLIIADFILLILFRDLSSTFSLQLLRTKKVYLSTVLQTGPRWTRHIDASITLDISHGHRCFKQIK